VKRVINKFGFAMLALSIVITTLAACGGGGGGGTPAPYLLLSANNGITGLELFRSDGTAAGTTLVKDINTNSDSNPGNWS
jgi:ELWxxDGT repeat protein